MISACFDKLNVILFSYSLIHKHKLYFYNWSIFRGHSFMTSTKKVENSENPPPIFRTIQLWSTPFPVVEWSSITELRRPHSLPENDVSEFFL